jgi:hypothetical protein
VTSVGPIIPIAIVALINALLQIAIPLVAPLIFDRSMNFVVWIVMGFVFAVIVGWAILEMSIYDRVIEPRRVALLRLTRHGILVMLCVGITASAALLSLLIYGGVVPPEKQTEPWQGYVAYVFPENPPTDAPNDDK